MVWNTQANYKLSYWMTYSPQTSWFLCLLFIVVDFFSSTCSWNRQKVCAERRPVNATCLNTAPERLRTVLTTASRWTAKPATTRPRATATMASVPHTSSTAGGCLDQVDQYTRHTQHTQHCNVAASFPLMLAGCCVNSLYLVRPSAIESNAKQLPHITV